MNFYCRCLARCFESSSKRSVEDLYIFLLSSWRPKADRIQLILGMTYNVF